MTRYPLSTPLRVLRGGSDQEITATSDVMEMARTFSGGWLGTAEGTDRGAISRRTERRHVPGRCQAEGAVSHGSAAPTAPAWDPTALRPPLPRLLDRLEPVLPGTRGTRAGRRQRSASDAQFGASRATEAGATPALVATGRPPGHVVLPSEGRAGELAGCEVIRSRCPVRGNSNFYERLNDNTSP